MIGYEFEFLVREGNKPLTKATFLKFHAELKKRGWKQKFDTGTGGLVGSEKNGFFVTSDDGVCTMELNTPPRVTIGESDQQIVDLLTTLQSIYRPLGCSIVGTSVFPGFFDTHNKKCKKFCVDEQCCEKAYIKYFNAQRFPAGHHALFLFAANQVWLDTTKERLMREWRVFSSLSPFLYALFSNGPIFNSAPVGSLEGRDLLWKEMLDSSIAKGDTRFFGMTPRLFGTLTEYFSFALAMPFYSGVRDGKPYKLQNPRTTYGEFFLTPASQAEFFDGTLFSVEPELSDFEGLQQKTFPHVRIKYKLKRETTLPEIVEAWKEGNEDRLLNCLEQVFLECRAISAQPKPDISAGPALLLGLQANLEETEIKAKRYSYSFLLQLYEVVQKDGLKARLDGVDVATVCAELLSTAEEGLKQRGFEEEKYLEPLMNRLTRKENPAQELMEIWKKEGLDGVWRNRDFSHLQ